VNLPVTPVGISTPINNVLDVLALIVVIAASSEIFTDDIVLS
jgi:formate/nitrite transporter FocA (FNT family)